MIEMHTCNIILNVTTKFLPLGLYLSTLKILQFSHDPFIAFLFFTDIKSEQSNPREICSILKKARRMTPRLCTASLLHFGFVWIFFFLTCPTWQPLYFQIQFSHWSKPGFSLFGVWISWLLSHCIMSLMYQHHHGFLMLSAAFLRLNDHM